MILRTKPAAWLLAVVLLACGADALAEQTIYDRDYPFIHYSGPPVHNDIARLQKALDGGTLTLKPSAQHGYLEAMLAALHINPDSQALVFSKTSLQIDAIGPATPRAIYFNDDTYVGWVQATGLLEIVTMDADRGPVFYTLSSLQEHPDLARESLRCLTCHDSYAEMGGGVPRFLFESTYDVQDGKLVSDAVARETAEDTPMQERWGGWYVTGNDGGAVHLGNITSVAAPTVSLDKARRGSLPNLNSLLDTGAYLRPTSDIVALLVLDHQVTVHNQIIRANYKTRTILNRELPDRDPAALRWADLTPKLQQRFGLLLRPLVDALLMAQAAPLMAKVSGSNAYGEWFQAQGLKDSRGRSLRDLDLTTRVFRYPMSYLIYSEGFNALPTFVREHVYARVGEILRADNPAAPYNRGSRENRLAAFEILAATKPDFAQSLRD